jgi:Ca2+-binding RTX toxin-like protein
MQQLFEQLEARQLRDATSPFVINGTSGNDVITVNYDPPPVVVMTRAATRLFRGGSVRFGSDRAVITVNGVTTTANIPLSQRLVINGLDGNDTIKVFGAHAVDAHGDKGNDTITGGAGADTIWGGWNDDVLRGGAGNDTLIGEFGNDNLQGDAGADLLSGSEGTDIADYAARTAPLSITVDGLPGDGVAGEGDNVGLDMERIECGSGNDFVSAAGPSWGLSIYGNLGNDTLEGSDGPDYIEGGNGADALFGLGGDDIIAGQWCWASKHPAPTAGDTGTNLIRGGAGKDSLYSGFSLGRDTLCGEQGDDFLFGDGNDILDGGAGDDDIIAP